MEGIQAKDRPKPERRVGWHPGQNGPAGGHGKCQHPSFHVNWPQGAAPPAESGANGVQILIGRSQKAVFKINAILKIQNFHDEQNVEIFK